MFYGGIEVYTSEDIGRNTIILFEFLENITMKDVLNKYEKIKEVFKDYEDVTVQKETFLLNGFWLKAKNVDESKIYDDDKLIFEALQDSVTRRIEFFVSKEEIIEYIKSDRADACFKEATKLVMHNRAASTAYLQRRLAIGYSRAARLIDIMELFGFIGPATDERFREVFITPEKFKEYFGEDFV